MNKFKLFLVTSLLFVIFGCREDNFENSETLRNLYKKYKNGVISECKLNGEKVYTASENAYDASTYIYDKDFNQVGICNYAWGSVDQICKDLIDCETIYRCKGHISGQPSIDKYGLD